MSEDENRETHQPSDASKEATKTAAKGAANAYFGPVGGKAVDALSKTKLGDAVLTRGAKQLEKQPFGRSMANMAQKSGALDAANKAMDASSGSAPSTSGSAPSSSMNLDDGNVLKGKGSTSRSSNNDNTDSEMAGEADATSTMLNSVKKHKFKLILPFIGLFFIFFIIIIIGGVVVSPAQTVVDFFGNAWDNLKTFVIGDDSTEKWELEYYKRLAQVQDEYSKKFGVCVDVNLITATLTVNTANDSYISEGSLEETDTPDGSELGLTGPDYKKMIKHIELLANMQIKRTVYGLDEAVKRSNKNSGISNDYCQEDSTEYAFGEDGDTSLTRAADFNIKYRGYFTNVVNQLSLLDFAVEGTPIRDSMDIRKIASNDLEPGLFKFFTKKANEERNIEYKFYVPAYTYVDKKDKDGKVIGKEKKCFPSVPTDPYDFAKLDIGELNNLDQNVYFWNLMDSFIADYYKDYLPPVSGPLVEGSKEYEKFKTLIQDIYLLYDEMGPNQSCQSSNFICRSDEGSDYYSGGTAPTAREDFIGKIAPIAIDEMTRTGVAASITLAQAIIESNNGNSGLSKMYSNYYGMTAGSCAPKIAPSGYAGVVYAPGEGGNTCKGNAFWDGTVVAMCNKSGKDCQWYRVYDSFANSTRDHSRLLSESYSCNSGDYEAQLDCIVKHGYATDPKYKSTILNMIKKYNLTQYDIGTWNGTVAPVNTPQYTSAICNNLGGASGDWQNWKQNADSWKDTKLGPSNLGTIGCAVTSVAIQIMRSGVATTLGANFNPGTFAEALTKVGGFDSKGNLDWSKVSQIAPNFVVAGRYRGYASPDTINNLVNGGYYVILNVKGGKHWVAVDRVDGDKIYMFDPGSGGTEVGQTYGLSSIVGYQLYKVS